MSDYDTSLKTLGIKEPFTEQDIKSAYRKLVKVHHPDKFTDPRNKEKATENFKKIQKSYEYLLKYGLGIYKNKKNTYNDTKEETKETKTNNKKTQETKKKKTEEQNTNDETVKNYRKRREQRKKEFYYYEDFDSEKDHKTKSDDYFYKEDQEKWKQQHAAENSEELKNGTIVLIIICILVGIFVIIASNTAADNSNKVKSYDQTYKALQNTNYETNSDYKYEDKKETETAENLTQTEEKHHNTQPAYEETYAEKMAKLSPAEQTALFEKTMAEHLNNEFNKHAYYKNLKNMTFSGIATCSGYRNTLIKWQYLGGDFNDVSGANFGSDFSEKFLMADGSAIFLGTDVSSNINYKMYIKHTPNKTIVKVLARYHYTEAEKMDKQDFSSMIEQFETRKSSSSTTSAKTQTSNKTKNNKSQTVKPKIDIEKETQLNDEYLFE